MHTEIRIITPELARRWLDDRNVRNRPLSRETVTLLARAIQRGEWQLTHQGIAFDENNDLIDGQHRLEAIARAGVPVEMVVTHGVARAAFAVVDTGRKRTGRDVLTLAEVGNSTHMAAALRGLHIYLTQPDIGWSGGATRVTHVQLLNLLDEHPGMKEAIVRGAALNRATKMTTTAASVGWYVTCRQRPEIDQSPWYDGLVSGAGLEAGDPRLTLRNTTLGLAAGKRHRRSDDSREHLHYYLKAWNAWVEGRELKLLRRYPNEKMPRISSKGGSLLDDLG